MNADFNSLISMMKELEVQKVNLISPSSDFINTKSKLDMKCSCGTEFNTTMQLFRAKAGRIGDKGKKCWCMSR